MIAPSSLTPSIGDSTSSSPLNPRKAAAAAARRSSVALESQFLRSGADVLQACVVSDSPATNVQLVAAGVGVAAVPMAMARADEHMGRVVRLLIAMAPSHVPSALVYRAAAKVSSILQQLRKAVHGT